MSDPQQLERELREYLEKEPNLRREDRLAYLKSIFKKHFEFTQLEHSINALDVLEVVSGAKTEYTKISLPLYVSGRRMEGSEIAHVAMLQSFIGYLNRMHLLKKLVKFDFRM